MTRFQWIRMKRTRGHGTSWLRRVSKSMKQIRKNRRDDEMPKNEGKISVLYQFALAALFLGVLCASHARAQELVAWPIGERAMSMLLPGMPVPPRPLPPIRPLPPVRPPIVRPPIVRPGPTPLPHPTPITPLHTAGYKVEGKVHDQVATLTFDITFRNTTPQRLEGVLLVPIPTDTTLSQFSMTVAGKTMKGELLEAERASTIYQTIVNSMRDPGLLELVGERLFRARVFPIEPNSDVQVHLTLTQMLHKSGDTINLAVPLRSAKFLQGVPGAKALVRLDFETTRPLRTLYSPLSGVEILKKDDRHASVSFEGDPSRTDSDFLLFYSLQENPLAASVLAYREEGEDGTFMVTLAPKTHADPKGVLPKDVVFIFDRSGSMEEDNRMAQSRSALNFCVKALDPKDRFAIVDFATEVNQFEPKLVFATPANKARALRYIERLESGGGTNIEGGLQEGSRLLASSEGRSGRVPMLFFMTDGLPTVGATDMTQLLRKVQEANKDLRARVFSFGVGSDVNTLFLDKLAQENRGAQDYVLPGETIENKVSGLYTKISKPALSDLKIEWNGVEVEQVYPRKVTDLFYGEELVLMGRYPKGGKGRLIVQGAAAGKPARFEFPFEFPKENLKTSFLPRLWAHRKVASELDAIRLTGRADPEVIREIVKLAKKHGIVTPYTSYLVTEEGFDLAAANRRAEEASMRMFQVAAGSGLSGTDAPDMAREAQRSSIMLSGASSGLGGGVREKLAPSALSAPLAKAAAPGMLAYRTRDAADEMEQAARKEAKDKGGRLAETRNLLGKTFYKRGNSWVDAAYELLSDRKLVEGAVEVEYMSEAYFKLIQDNPSLARYLALGPNVTVVHNGKTYKITESSTSDPRGGK